LRRIESLQMDDTSPLRLSLMQHAELLAIVRKATAEQRQVFRAKIVLGCAGGRSVSEVARRLGTTRPTVRLWRDRYAEIGDIEALDDFPRSGRPPRVPLFVRCELVKLACTRPDPGKTRFRDTWTRGQLAAVLERETGYRLSITEVGRILRAEGVRPHRVRMWLHSPDPEFRRKVRRICELYVAPPAGATVLSVDEKTCIQALSRKHPMRPAAPGQPVREEFEYKRHGVRALIGAFDIRSGRVLAHVRARRTAADLDAFMEDVARAYPKGEVYIVWDNLNIHHGDAWTRFNERHGGRFHFVHTPLHASWVNQIEIWFGILQRRVLRHGEFGSVLELEHRLLQFVRHWNREEAHPFRWTFRGRFAQHRAVRRAA
jgi:transposase